jgi:membrane protease YdiL (CAAX protease family)
MAGADWCTACFSPVTAKTPVTAKAPAPVLVTTPAPPRSAPGPAPQPPAWTPPAWEPPAWTPPRTVTPAAPPAAATAVDHQRQRDAGSVYRMAMGIVALGAVIDLAVYLWARSGHVESVTFIRTSLMVTAAFYVVVAATAVHRARRISFRPVWSEGDSLEAVVYGLGCGSAVALGLLGLTQLATGRLSADPGITTIVSERTPIRIAAAFLLACVAAPWVEELLFRGLLAESLRGKGVKAAAATSGIFFALWHPQALYPILDAVLGHGGGGMGTFFYYVGMGVLFARLYFKRGLKSTIAAHTAFNAVIVLSALVSVSGVAHLVTGNGVTARVPGTWSSAPSPPADLHVTGPSGAELVILHHDMPPGVFIDAAMAAEALNQAASDPHLQVTANSTRRVDYPMGQGVRLEAKSEGHAVVLVTVPKGTVLWEIVVATGGSDHANRDFEDILQHIQLP